MYDSRFTRFASFTLVVVLLVSGCASSTLAPIKTLDTAPRPYRSVLISVESKVTQDVTKEIATLQEALAKKIRKSERFGAVTLAPSGPDAMLASNDSLGLLIKTTVTGIRKVGGGTRFLLGAFAGKASLSTDVEFIDMASHTTVASYSLKEKTGSTGFAGTTGDCVDKTAKAIAKLAAERFSGPLASTQ